MKVRNILEQLGKPRVLSVAETLELDFKSTMTKHDLVSLVSRSLGKRRTDRGQQQLPTCTAFGGTSFLPAPACRPLFPARGLNSGQSPVWIPLAAVTAGNGSHSGRRRSEEGSAVQEALERPAGRADGSAPSLRRRLPLGLPDPAGRRGDGPMSACRQTLADITVPSVVHCQAVDQLVTARIETAHGARGAGAANGGSKSSREHPKTHPARLEPVDQLGPIGSGSSMDETTSRDLRQAQLFPRRPSSRRARLKSADPVPLPLEVAVTASAPGHAVRAAVVVVRERAGV